MIAWRRLAAGPGLIVLAGITGCDSTISLGPGAPLTDVRMVVSTSETWGGRKVMIVGEEGHVNVTCTFGDLTSGNCDPHTPALTTSAPGIISIHSSVPGSAALRAHAPGTATITGTVAGLERELSIEVYAERLPIDDLWLALTRPAAWCAECQASYDNADRLEAILMPAGGSVPFTVNATRDGESVTLPISQSTTDAGVAVISKGCRPPSIDPNCDVVAAYWVTALSLGTADLSVTARNLTVSLGVEVLDSP